MPFSGASGTSAGTSRIGSASSAAAGERLGPGFGRGERLFGGTGRFRDDGRGEEDVVRWSAIQAPAAF